MTYYIYHIPERQKIGVTDDIERRMKQHRCDNYEILEEHTSIDVVDRREVELQEQYGYRVDQIPYSHTITMNRLGGTGIGLRKLTMEDARAIRTNGLSERKCAKVYGVSRGIIRKIRKNMTYRE